jgi:hypothetical protein
MRRGLRMVLEKNLGMSSSTYKTPVIDWNSVGVKMADLKNLVNSNQYEESKNSINDSNKINNESNA